MSSLSSRFFVANTDPESRRKNSSHDAKWILPRREADFSTARSGFLARRFPLPQRFPFPVRSLCIIPQLHPLSPSLLRRRPQLSPSLSSATGSSHHRSDPAGCSGNCEPPPPEPWCRRPRLGPPWTATSLLHEHQPPPPSSSLAPSPARRPRPGRCDGFLFRKQGLLGQSSPIGPPSPGFMSSIYSSSGMYNANAYGSGFWYGSHIYGPGLYGGWNALSNRKYKPGGKTYGSYGFGNENMDGLNELKRGPRSSLFKNQQGFGEAVVTPAKAQELPSSDGSNAVVQDQYNRADFVETYSDAKFFIIKSYSEDDVHKSIKYNVWASTPNGNKKLDTAYQAAKGNLSNSPVFLFFSVNTSGQFVGLAEMVGQVDFSKTVEYWQQDKWTGCFPVKWHIVKDIPNSLLKHIILEYNENKPVTNSRDTQEVKLEKGLQMLKIFKDHVCKTSILDDFGFYGNREKIMQEKKSRRQHPLEKIMSRKLTENEDIDGKQGLQKLGVVGEQNTVENGVVTVAVNGVAPKDVNVTTVANGC